MALDPFSDKLASFYKMLPQELPLIALGGALCFVTTRYIIYVVRRGKVQLRIAERKKKAQEGIKKIQKILMSEDVDESILSLSFEELQSCLQDGRLSATRVLKAYQTAALRVNDISNAVTDVIPSAMELAEMLDKKIPEERGPLHGIPISLKESIGLKGEDCTAGLAELIGNPLPDDSVFVKELKECGAIPYVRTNIPQAMRSFATDNPIFGLTVNPLNTGRSPGGSSGGEGAIIGGGGSILGVGSDIAGSIRIPCAYCGIPGLKPTNNRISFAGNFGYGTNLCPQKLVPPAYGPMGKDVNSLVQFMRCVLRPSMFNLDPTTPPIPFREEMFVDKRRLRIGYYTYDGNIRCVPAVVRAVHEAKAKLESLGHTVVEFHPPDATFAVEQLLYPAFFGDNCEAYRDLVKYDNTCDVLYDWVRLFKYPYFIRWLLGQWEIWTKNDTKTAQLIMTPKIRGVSGWWRKYLDLKRFQGNFLNEWKSKNLDLVICPVMPSVALKNGLDRKLLATVNYTSLYNVLNYPAGTVPVAKVSKDDVTKVNDPQQYDVTTRVEKLMKEDFTEDAVGMPIGIQVVGLPYSEETVLRVMAELEASLK